MSDTQTKPTFIRRLKAWFRRVFHTGPVLKTTEEVAEVADHLASAVGTVAADLGPILNDANDGLVAVRPFTGMVAAVVPGAGQALAIAAEAVIVAQEAVKEIGVVTGVVLAVAADASKLDDAAAAVAAVLPTTMAAADASTPLTPTDASPGEGPINTPMVSIIQSSGPHLPLPSTDVMAALPLDPATTSPPAGTAAINPGAPMVVVVATAPGESRENS